MRLDHLLSKVLLIKKKKLLKEKGSGEHYIVLKVRKYSSEELG